MRRRAIWLLPACVLLLAALYLGCGGGSSGSSDGGATPFLILGMDNGSTGFEPYMVKDNVATLLKDCSPGANGSYPYGFTSLNGKVYFQANDGTNGSELWVTDGTAAGTVLLKDIWPGAGGSYPINYFGPDGYGYQSGTYDKLWFVANDGTSGGELWTTDGTAAGTAIWSDFRSGTFDGVWFD